MKKLAIVVGSMVLSMPLGAYAQSSVVAQVGQASVTQADVAQMIKSLSPENRERLAADPRQLDAIVRGQLAEKAVLAEAQAKGWDKQPQVRAMVQAAQREVILRSYLASVAAPPAAYPSDAQIRAAYDQNKASFMVPRMLRIAQIYLAVPPNADAAALSKARAQATDLARRARAPGADFAALAQANSQDKQSAAKGGDMGFVPQTLLLPEIRQAAESMKPGDIAGPIQTSAGFHVFKLTDTRPAAVAPFAEVKERIRLTLRQQRAQQEAQAYMAKLVAPSAVTINEAALSKAVSAAQ